MSLGGPTPVGDVPQAPGQTPFGARVLAAGSTTHPTSSSADDWQWRLLLASIDAEVPARALSESLAPDSRMQLAPLDGPMQLQCEGQPALQRLRLQVSPLEQGQGATISAPEANRVVCLQWRSSLQATLIARPLQGPMLLPPRRDSRWLAWLIAGHAQLHVGEQCWPLPLDRPTWLPSPPDQRMRIEGGGELVLLRLGPIDEMPPLALHA